MDLFLTMNNMIKLLLLCFITSLFAYSSEGIDSKEGNRTPGDEDLQPEDDAVTSEDTEGELDSEEDDDQDESTEQSLEKDSDEGDVDEETSPDDEKDSKKTTDKIKKDKGKKKDKKRKNDKDDEQDSGEKFVDEEISSGDEKDSEKAADKSENDKEKKKDKKSIKKKKNVLEKKVDISDEEKEEVIGMFGDDNVFFTLPNLTGDQLVFFFQEVSTREIRDAVLDLSANPNVTTDILPGIIEILEKNPHAFNAVYLSNIPIGDEGVKILFATDTHGDLLIKSLRYIYLQNCSITVLPDEFFAALSNSETEISLENNNLTPETYVLLTNQSPQVIGRIKCSPIESELQQIPVKISESQLLEQQAVGSSSLSVAGEPMRGSNDPKLLSEREKGNHASAVIVANPPMPIVTG